MASFQTRATRMMASMVRSTSDSVFAHDETLIRIAVRAAQRALRAAYYSRGEILSAASFEVMTGYTSKSVRSLQFAIHSSSRRRSGVSIT